MKAHQAGDVMQHGMELAMNASSFPEELASLHHSLQEICYEHRIPDFADAEMMRLYGSSFSSAKRFQIWQQDRDVSTYLVKENDLIKTLLLFRLEHGKVYVLNEVITLEKGVIERFSRYIFATYLTAKVILFKAVHAEFEQLDLPFHKYNCSENIVASLPVSNDEYWASLGKSTRQNISRFRNKLSREMPSYTFAVYEGEEIEEHSFRRLIELSRARLSEKNKEPGWSEDEIERLIRLAKSSGLMGVIIIEGTIYAGVVCYKAGENYCLEVMAHDPEFNEYRLGRLCCYLTICACIDRGAKEFHFLWGQYEYKYHFLGVQRNLYRIVIYRSAIQQMLNGRLALETVSQRIIRQAKLWVNSDETRHNPMSRVAIHSIRGLKGMKAHRPAQRM